MKALAVAIDRQDLASTGGGTLNPHYCMVELPDWLEDLGPLGQEVLGQVYRDVLGEAEDPSEIPRYDYLWFQTAPQDYPTVGVELTDDNGAIEPLTEEELRKLAREMDRLP